MPAVFERAEIPERSHDAFRQEKAGGESPIVPGRSHDDGERLAVQPHLERLFDRDEIVRSGMGVSNRSSDANDCRLSILCRLGTRRPIRHGCAA
jgi:hypothetical protein